MVTRDPSFCGAHGHLWIRKDTPCEEVCRGPDRDRCRRVIVASTRGSRAAGLVRPGSTARIREPSQGLQLYTDEFPELPTSSQRRSDASLCGDTRRDESLPPRT